jgi:hypothetical protein
MPITRSVVAAAQRIKNTLMTGSGHAYQIYIKFAPEHGFIQRSARTSAAVTSPFCPPNVTRR